MPDLCNPSAALPIHQQKLQELFFLKTLRFGNWTTIRSSDGMM
jgi:hypothetical protein